MHRFQLYYQLLYLYCVDPGYVSELTIPSLPFLKLKCLYGHVSFPGSLSERRMVVFPKCKRVLDKIKDIVSPCVIEGISSVEFQVRSSKCNNNFPPCSNCFRELMCNILTELQIHLDEVEDDGELMVIWDFDMDRINLSFTASQCSVKAQIPSAVNTIYSMPYLDSNRVNCNCAKSSKQEKVLLSLSCAATTAASQLRRLSLSHVNDDDALEEEGEEEAELEVEVELEDVEEEIDLLCDRVNDSGGAELFAPENSVCECGETLFTESFTLKGSSYHDQF